MMRPLRQVLLAVALASCGDPRREPMRDDSVDPAIASALADPLMADPHLDRRSNAGALRPADQPYQAMVPQGIPDALPADALPTLVGRLRPLMAKTFAGCDLNVGYSYQWAARLPTDLELPKDGQVFEAAGSDTGSCHLRLVAFTTLTNQQELVGSYQSSAKASGFSVSERRSGSATVITGQRARDGAAFVLSVYPTARGSSVDLVSNRGR